MAKQQTRSKRLENIYRQARMDLPRHMFTSLLSYAWGIFEAVAKFGRPIKHGDISMIEKELKGLRAKAGYLPICQLKDCERPALEGLEFCSEHHAILATIEIDREVEQEFQIEREV